MKNKFRLSILFLFFSGSSFCAPNNWWNKKNIHTSHNYVFGYGSLVNGESRQSTLGHYVDAIPARISPSFGFRRSWNYKVESPMTALGIEKSEQNTSSINGVVFPVPDIEIWDKREMGYTRIAVPWKMVESVGWQKLPHEGILWLYLPKKEFTHKGPGENKPIVQSYLDLCLEGYLSYSVDFAREFLSTTYGWSAEWINDRLYASRPWVYLKTYNLIDQLLEENEDTSSYFKIRKYPMYYHLDAAS